MPPSLSHIRASSETDDNARLMCVIKAKYIQLENLKIVEEKQGIQTVYKDPPAQKLQATEKGPS